ncbi:MAG TPA: hypothetical protein V6C63_01000 [Allocoleopsis sp.]
MTTHSSHTSKALTRKSEANKIQTLPRLRHSSPVGEGTGERSNLNYKSRVKLRWSWAAAPLTMLLWQGGVAIASELSLSQPSLLVAQEFNFEAPPAPPNDLPPVIVPRDPTLPTLEPAPAPFPNSPASVTAPTVRPLPSETYLVYVNGNSPLMLDQVRRVEPEAFRKEYRGRTVIQVGQFIDQSNARRRAEALRDQGIRAEIAQVSRTGSSGSASSKGYYVVVPAGRNELTAIRAQVRRLAGDLQVNIIPRDRPRGHHIAVGPFTNWDAANSWNRYVKDFGINNARVYYGR